ncbi:MAG: DUF4282 domain-containing protein [Synergistales bacterium]|jgi:hypothetical protein|nr:DUF4282 domain-containing protein [Synergistales bacterium]MBP8996376.1 DUF4282 domain-containing protein [Synergistales bacterium]
MAGLDAIIGYLDFDLLIGPAVIKILYFVGAFVMPFVAWLLLRRISSRYPQATRSFSELAGKTGKGPRAWLLFALAVAVLEMTWRVVCEYFIACLQISQTLEYLAN